MRLALLLLAKLLLASCATFAAAQEVRPRFEAMWADGTRLEITIHPDEGRERPRNP